jgi:hypothetical protein
MLEDVQPERAQRGRRNHGDFSLSLRSPPALSSALGAAGLVMVTIRDVDVAYLSQIHAWGHGGMGSRAYGMGMHMVLRVGMGTLSRA